MPSMTDEEWAAFTSPERRESRRKGRLLMDAILTYGIDHVFDPSKPLEDQEVDLASLPRRFD